METRIERFKNVGELESKLNQAVKLFIAVAPKNYSITQLFQTSYHIFKSGDLQKCDGNSIVNSLVIAAQLGLDPSGASGQAYLVPFWSSKLGGMQCQLIIGYRGLIDLILRGKKIEQIYAQPVYAGDKFKIKQGSVMEVIHEPHVRITANLKPQSRKLVGVYMRGVAVSGKDFVSWMPIDELNEVEARVLARMPKDKATGKPYMVGPWKTDKVQMQLKTIIRRDYRMLPRNPYIALGARVDEIAELGGGEQKTFADAAQEIKQRLDDSEGQQNLALNSGNSGAEPVESIYSAFIDNLEYLVTEKVISKEKASESQKLWKKAEHDETRREYAKKAAQRREEHERQKAIIQ